jgi:O-antigen ligase/polysaccharide polymerase Wzy-like membrane protein
MSFALFVVYLLVVFVRPSERYPDLREWPIFEVASILALVGAALAVLMGSRPALRVIQVPLIFALVIWMALTVGLSPLRSVEGFEKVLGFVKGPLTAFMLVLLNVTTVRKVRAMAFFLTIAAIVLAERTISDYQRHAEEVARITSGDLDTPGAETEWDNPDPEQPRVQFDPNQEFRVMNKGLFGDPNDLALTLIAILPFTVIRRRSGAYLSNVLFVWLPIAVILYGVYATKSRGGVLALAAVIGLLVRHRLGNYMSMVTTGVMVVALLGIGFVGSRSMEVDRSASGRIEMWSAGLQNLKQSPVWGVGYRNFDAVNERAAHSSYVECFAELGMVGYFLWLGLLLLTLDDLRLIHASTNEEAADLRKWARATQVSLIGFLVGSIFLSRAYDVQMFILIGLGTAIAELARRRGQLARNQRGVLIWIYIVGGSALATIVGYWLYMRFLR